MSLSKHCQKYWHACERFVLQKSSLCLWAICLQAIYNPYIYIYVGLGFVYEHKSSFHWFHICWHSHSHRCRWTSFDFLGLPMASASTLNCEIVFFFQFSGILFLPPKTGVLAKAIAMNSHPRKLLATDLPHRVEELQSVLHGVAAAVPRWLKFPWS